MPCHTEPDPAEQRRYAAQLRHNANAAHLLCHFMRTREVTPEHSAWFASHRQMDRENAIRETEDQLQRARHAYDQNPTVANHEVRRALLERLDRLRASNPLNTELY